MKNKIFITTTLFIICGYFFVPFIEAKSDQREEAKQKIEEKKKLIFNKLDIKKKKNQKKGTGALLQFMHQEQEEATQNKGKKNKGRKNGHIRVEEATSSSPIRRRAIHGIITDISGTTLTLSHRRHQERTYLVSVTDTTVVHEKKSSPSAEVKLEIGQRIVAVGKSEQNTLIATRIMIIPKKSTGLPSVTTSPPVATSSPAISTAVTPTSASASPSATPIITATPSTEPTPSPTSLPQPSATHTLSPTP